MIVIVGGATCRGLVLVLGRSIDVDHLAPAEDSFEAIEDQRIIPFTLLVVLASGGERSPRDRRQRSAGAISASSSRARRSAAGCLDNAPNRRHAAGGR